MSKKHKKDKFKEGIKYIVGQVSENNKTICINEEFNISNINLMVNLGVIARDFYPWYSVLNTYNLTDVKSSAKYVASWYNTKNISLVDPFNGELEYSKVYQVITSEDELSWKYQSLLNYLKEFSLYNNSMIDVDLLLRNSPQYRQYFQNDIDKFVIIINKLLAKCNISAIKIKIDYPYEFYLNTLKKLVQINFDKIIIIEIEKDNVLEIENFLQFPNVCVVCNDDCDKDLINFFKKLSSNSKQKKILFDQNEDMHLKLNGLTKFVKADLINSYKYILEQSTTLIKNEEYVLPIRTNEELVVVSSLNIEEIFEGFSETVQNQILISSILATDLVVEINDSLKKNYLFVIANTIDLLAYNDILLNKLITLKNNGSKFIVLLSQNLILTNNFEKIFNAIFVNNKITLPIVKIISESIYGFDNVHGKLLNSYQCGENTYSSEYSVSYASLSYSKACIRDDKLMFKIVNSTVFDTKKVITAYIINKNNDTNRIIEQTLFKIPSNGFKDVEIEIILEESFFEDEILEEYSILLTSDGVEIYNVDVDVVKEEVEVENINSTVISSKSNKEEVVEESYITLEYGHFVSNQEDIVSTYFEEVNFIFDEIDEEVELADTEMIVEAPVVVENKFEELTINAIETPVPTKQARIMGRDNVSFDALCKYLYEYFCNEGLSLTKDTIMSFVSSICGSRFIMIDGDENHVQKFVNILSNCFNKISIDSLNAPSLVEKSSYNTTVDTNFALSIMNEKYSAEELNFAFFTDANVLDLEKYFDGVLPYIESPSEEFTIDISGKKCKLPINIWFIMTAPSVNSPLDKALLSNIMSVKLFLENEAKVEAENEYNPILMYTDFINYTTRSRQENYIIEEDWKKLDLLFKKLKEDFGFEVDNVFIRKIERYSSIYLLNESDINIGKNDSHIECLEHILIFIIFDTLIKSREIDESNLASILVMLGDVFELKNITNLTNFLKSNVLKKE